MKTNFISIVLYGVDERLLETRKWVLQSRGYRVVTVQHVAELAAIPLHPAIELLVLCHSLSPSECAEAGAYASSRWPRIKKLALVRAGSKRPEGILSQVLETLDGPARLVSTVSELVGHAPSSSHSHTY